MLLLLLLLSGCVAVRDTSQVTPLPAAGSVPAAASAPLPPSAVYTAVSTTASDGIPNPESTADGAIEGFAAQPLSVEAAPASVAAPAAAPAAANPLDDASDVETLPEISERPFEGPVTAVLDEGLPNAYTTLLSAVLAGADAVDTLDGPQPLRLAPDASPPSVDVTRLALVSPLNTEANSRSAAPSLPKLPVWERYYAVVVPFATVQDDVASDDLRARWQGDEPLFVLARPPGSTADAMPNALTDVTAMLGAASGNVESLATVDEIAARLAETPGALAIVPFDQLDPRFKVLRVDNVNPLDNELRRGDYPLALTLRAEGWDAGVLVQFLRDGERGLGIAATNRAPSRLTTLVMTGVTAMSRGTAAAMDREGVTYPAEIIGPELSRADITHASNEVPFLENCVTRNVANNLTLCSKPSYWAALEAIGTDIVGLSGNHVNDFGYAGARESLAWYRENEIPIYGSGGTVEEACAPLRWTHNGNTLAFVAIIAWGPPYAWVGDDSGELPGTCYYYDHKERVLETVRELANEVDVVAVEFQHEESYQPYPLARQIAEFREMREAGAEIVTGVQSHVPQSMEPYGADDPGGAGIISYGLGNLFFDQMWSWQTRTNLIARHTIYEGRVINTEILTTVLEDYAQPRWTTPDERVELLQRIFNAAPARPN